MFEDISDRGRKFTDQRDRMTLVMPGGFPSPAGNATWSGKLPFSPKTSFGAFSPVSVGIDALNRLQDQSQMQIRMAGDGRL